MLDQPILDPVREPIPKPASVPWLFVILVLLGMALASGCARHNYAPVEDLERPRKVTSGYHIVREGETLFAIAFRYGRNYRDLAQVNRIPYPYVIKPGQRISLALKPRTQKKPKTVAAPTVKSTAKPKTVVRTGSSIPKHTGPLKWRWPLKGRISNYFVATGSKGIDIEVNGRGSVRAAADGVVVYAGDGLKGYGNLVIIQHDATYLSAYANNSRLLVSEKKSVKAGEKIAEISSTGRKKPALHFEIRKNGHPVNPIKYLPRG